MAAEPGACAANRASRGDGGFTSSPCSERYHTARRRRYTEPLMPRLQSDKLFLVGLLLILPSAGRAQQQQAPAARAAPDSEPKNTAKGVEGDYLRALHTRIHYRFANKFIEDVAAKRPPTDPLNNPALRTEVNFGIRWDGTVTDAIVAEKSAVPAFELRHHRPGHISVARRPVHAAALQRSGHLSVARQDLLRLER